VGQVAQALVAPLLARLLRRAALVHRQAVRREQEAHKEGRVALAQVRRAASIFND
jgi:hypothetical protein